MSINWKRLIVSVIFCEATGIFGSIFTINSIPSWYVYLNKPEFSPPNFLFGPVWTILYLLMGISLYLIWQKKKIPAVFWLQLFLNAVWTPVFFGLKNPFLGLIVIILLLIFITLTIKKFYRINSLAGLLLIPYLLWVYFATYLNYQIWVLNR